MMLSTSCFQDNDSKFLINMLYFKFLKTPRERFQKLIMNPGRASSIFNVLYFVLIYIYIFFVAILCLRDRLSNIS